jgi:K+-transporting ATPase ATPase A chain
MAYVKALTLEGAEKLIPGGPAASQIAIKQIGTNGGGFFGVNSAHPFENPTPLSNFLQMFSLLLIPSFLVFTFGVLVRNMKHAAALWITMMIIFVGGLVTALYFQNQPNLSLSGIPFIEGTETRFGVNSSTLWGMATTVASNGSVNAMHSSFAPIAGGIAIFNMLLGEIVFGGVGSGLYGMVLFAILTVFLAGLMVGRTPEYLGRKIGSREVILSSIGVFLPSVMVLVGVALAVSTSLGVSSVANAGPHALSEILYAFASASNNNGSAFAGLNANTDFYNISLGICMLVGRFGVMIPVLAIAGSLASKRVAPPSEGTFPTHGLLFVIFLTAVILIVGALTFFPVLTLGPIAEYLLMMKAQTF